MFVSPHYFILLLRSVAFHILLEIRFNIFATALLCQTNKNHSLALQKYTLHFIHFCLKAEAAFIQNLPLSRKRESRVLYNMAVLLNVLSLSEMLFICFPT